MRFGRLTLRVLLIGAGLASGPASSQEQGFEDFHTWADITTIKQFDDRWRYDGDYGIRGLLTDSDWTQLYFRPSVRYARRPWMHLHGGAALFHSFFSPSDVHDLSELRPWLGLRFLGPRPGGFTVSNYFRLELRAFYLRDGRGWDSVLRGRWQIQVRSPDFAIGSTERLYALTSFEAFQDFGASIDAIFGDRFRYNLGVGKRAAGGSRIELNYLFHRIRFSGADGDVQNDDHVVRLRLFYRLD